MIRKPRVFYGWVIVGIAIFTMTLTYGVRHSFSIFFPYILDEFDWSRGSTAIMLSLNILMYGFFSPVTGSLCDRWNPRKVMMIGIFILALATAGCALANELWHFYLFFGILVPMGTAFSGWPLIAPALANWFAKKRGLVLGLGQMGIGLSFCYSMLSELTISQVGWRYAYFALAMPPLALLLPLYLLYYYRPEDKGMNAYGTGEVLTLKASMPDVQAAKNLVSGNLTLQQAIRTSRLWLMVLSNFLYCGIANYLVLGHQVKFAEDVGYDSMFAASIFALFGVFMVTGQFSSSISDWIGREKTITISAILTIGALLALVSVIDTSQPWLLYVYAICFGYGVGLYAPTIIAGTADLFYGRHIGTIIGLLITGMGLGGAIGPWLGGYIYDTSGSYSSAFILCIVCSGLACISFWIAAPRSAARLRERT